MTFDLHLQFNAIFVVLFEAGYGGGGISIVERVLLSLGLLPLSDSILIWLLAFISVTLRVVLPLVQSHGCRVDD